MVLYLKLDQHVWVQGDYTDSSTYDISGTVYRDYTLSTAETSLDTFTGSFRLINEQGSIIYEDSTVLTLNSNGTFTVLFTISNSPATYGSYKVRLKLEKSGSRLTAVGVNGSDRVFIEYN